jgi:hypothetical protein
MILAGKRTYGWVTFRLNGPSDGIGGLVVGAKAADLFPTSQRCTFAEGWLM